MVPEREKVFFDNPLESERLPDEPLSFEFVAETEEGAVTGQILFPFHLVGLITVAVLLALMLFPNWQSGFRNNLQLPVSILGLGLALGWVLHRRQMVGKGSPLLGLSAAALLYLLTLLAPLESQLLHLTSAILFLYATGEFTIHWAILKQRGTDPIIHSDLPLKPHMEKDLGYEELMVLPSLGALAIATHHLVPAGEVILIVLASGVCSFSLAKSARRQTPAYKLLWFAIRNACLYPDAKKTAPGLVKTPLVDRGLRPFPIALFTATSVYSAVVFSTYAGSLAALLLLLSVWTYIATEFTYDY